MAEKDSTTKTERAVLHWGAPKVQELIAILRAVRANGDLLTAAEDPSVLLEDTLLALGSHLIDMATKGLVILGYEEPQEETEQTAPGPEGGAK